jgi:hypothetical protein
MCVNSVLLQQGNVNTVGFVALLELYEIGSCFGQFFGADIP